MKYFFFIISSIFLFTACSSEEQAKAKELSALAGCYSMTIEKDTAFLNLIVKDTTVNGVLQYNWFQKDDNSGTITGVVRDSLIYLNYSFESEGMSSVREVIFKHRKGQLYEAFGEIDQRNDTVIYRDRGLLQFDMQHPFIKSNCK